MTSKDHAMNCYTVSFRSTCLFIVLAFAMLALTSSALASWIYTPGAGTQNNCPYSGIISDGNWQIRVYQPDASSDDFWLGCGGNGTGARVDGSGALDLSTLLADTTAAGTPVRAVNVAPYFFKNVGTSVTSLVLPSTVTNIGNVAFENCKLTSANLSNTQIRTIQGFAFARNQSLAEVWLPETLEYIGKCAFRTMPDKVTFHFAGDVPKLAPPTDPNAGSSYSVYVNHSEYQNIYQGGADKQWAFCVNAQKYPNWTRIAKANYYDSENPFPSGEANWPPQSARNITGYTAPFGNTWFSRTSDTSSNGRSYLIQEGTWSGAQVARPFLGDAAVEAHRNDITITIPVYPGSSGSAELVFTFGDQILQRTVTANGDQTFAFSDLPDSTAYAWSISVSAANGTDSASGSVATLTPDIVIGNPTYEQTKDGLAATISVTVTSLLSESGTVRFDLNGSTVETRPVTEVGTLEFTITGLVLGTEYMCTFTADAGTDEDVKSISFVAERYKWTYVEGAGSNNGKPYTGTITDKNWTLRVYRPDDFADAFWLGCGGTGAGAVVAGSGELDLTQVLDDTTGDGTPVRLVRIANLALKRTGSLTSFVLPNTVTNIGNVAFETCQGLVSADLSPAPLKSIGGCAFAWCNQLLSVRFPKTLNLVGACAFTVIHDKCVFHFAGPPPELVDNSGDKTGTEYAAYLNTNVGEYRNFSRGADNAQLAFCVDNRVFPGWNALSDTTWYTDENPFPSGEVNWIPESVRYTVNDDYKAPLGTTKFGRTNDASTNGRTYLIFEKHGKLGFFLFVR